MHANTLTCPSCGRTGTVTGDWVTPGVAVGTLMTGLDPESCKGCRDVLNTNGYTVVKANPDGTIEAE